MTRPPVAQLIYEHRIKTGLSIRQAAARAGISEGSWRRTESPRKLTRTPETIAKMAGAVGVTGDQLEAAGWQQAAEVLAALDQPAPAAEPVSYADLVRLVDRQEVAIARLERNIDRILGRRENRDDEEEGEHEDNGSRNAG